MSVSLNPISRLRFSDLMVSIGLDGTMIEYWDLADIPGIPHRSNDLTYQINGGDRMDRLAYRFYGSPSFWWVIAVANEMELLPVDMKEGSVVRIPDPQYVRSSAFFSNTTR